MTLVQPETLPSKQEAVLLYEQTYGGRLTDEHPFGHDPLAGYDDRIAERDRLFFQRFSIQQIFSDCVNGRSQLLTDTLIFYIQTTLHFQATL